MLLGSVDNREVVLLVVIGYWRSHVVVERAVLLVVGGC